MAWVGEDTMRQSQLRRFAFALLVGLLLVGASFLYHRYKDDYDNFDPEPLAESAPLLKTLPTTSCTV